MSMDLGNVGGKLVPQLALQNGHVTRFDIGDVAHQQMAELAGIPKTYYDRMRTSFPELLRDNVNGWFGKEPRTQRLVRTLDGRARAVLSDRFRPLDNFDLMEAVLPTLQQNQCNIVSSEITEKRLYLKAILPNLEAEIRGVQLGIGHNRVGEKNIVVAAVTISNSEVGHGSLSIMPAVFDTWCTNLAQMTTRFFRKYHIGGSGQGGDDVNELLSTATRRKLDAAFFAQVGDVIRGTFSDKGFREAVAAIQEAADAKIESRDLPAVVELAADRFALPKENRPSILRNLIERGELSRWGLASAITAEAGRIEDYELANDFEQVGGKVIELAKNDWAEISSAVSKN